MIPASSTLNFAEDGFGYIDTGVDVEGEERMKWVNDVLRFSVFLEEGSVEGQEIFWDSMTETEEPMAHLLHDGKAWSFKIGQPGNEHTMECYSLAVPMRFTDEPGFCRRVWTMVMPLHHMLGQAPPPNNRWICRHGKNLATWMVLMGFADGEQHVRPSKKALLDRYRMSGTGSPGGLAASPLEEFSVSSHGLICWASTWASNNQLKGWGDHRRLDLVKFSKQLLTSVLAMALDEGVYDVQVCGSVVQVVDTSFDQDALEEAVPFLKRRMVCLRQPSGCVPFQTFLVFCVNLLWKNQQSVDLCTMLRELVVDLVSFAATACELMLHNLQALSTRDTYLDMGILRGPKGGTRRMSSGFKMAVINFAAGDQDIHDVGQLVAVQNALKRRQGEEPKGPSPKVAKTFRRTWLYNYWLRGRRTFESIRHINLSLDAVRVGGVKYLTIALWSAEKKLGMWMPPQVRQTRFTTSVNTVYEVRKHRFFCTVKILKPYPPCFQARLLQKKAVFFAKEVLGNVGGGFQARLLQCCVYRFFGPMKRRLAFRGYPVSVSKHVFSPPFPSTSFPPRFQARLFPKTVGHCSRFFGMTRPRRAGLASR